MALTLTRSATLALNLTTVVLSESAGVLDTLHAILGEALTAALSARAPLNGDLDACLLRIYVKHRSAIAAAYPESSYTTVLQETFVQMVKELELQSDSLASLKFSLSVAEWPARHGAVEALMRLGRRYGLVALSAIKRREAVAICDGVLAQVAFEDVGSREEWGCDGAEYHLKWLHEAEAEPDTKARLEEGVLYVCSVRDAAIDDDSIEVVQLVGGIASTAAVYESLRAFADEVDRAFEEEERLAAKHEAGEVKRLREAEAIKVLGFVTLLLAVVATFVVRQYSARSR